MHIHTYVVSQNEVQNIAEKILSLNPKVITLSGPLGAGKTTLVQQILKKLGIVEPVQSPTYAYVTTYTTSQDQKIYHFDLYRLRNMQDFIDAGFEEYLYQENALCIIEWPEIIESLLLHDICAIKIAYEDTEKRKISVYSH